MCLSSGIYFSALQLKKKPVLISEDQTQRLILLAFQQRPLLFKELLNQTTLGKDILHWPKDHNGESLLHWSALGGCSSCVDILLSMGHPIDLKNDKGRDALSYAVEFEDIELIEKLLSSGANPHSFKDENGASLRELVRRMGNDEITELFKRYK